MNREEIEEKAQCWIDNYPQLDECTYTQDDADMMMKNSFIAGAEWMQEQMINRACNFLCDTCHASYANDCKNKPCKLKTGLIETMKGE